MQGLQLVLGLLLQSNDLTTEPVKENVSEKASKTLLIRYMADLGQGRPLKH